MERLTQTFYKEADQFIENLRSFCSSYSELESLDENLYTSQNEIRMAKRLVGNKSHIPTLFFTSLQPYENHILNQNEDFFLSYKLDSNDTESNQLVTVSQKVWKSGKLDESSKESIWKYVTLLYRLAKMISTQ